MGLGSNMYVCIYVQASTTVNEAAQQSQSATPRIGAFLGENDQYFIFIEGNVLCKVSKFPDALFLMFSAFYIFYLEYPTPVKNVMFFLQDYIYMYPDSSNRNATYLSVASDIKRNL